MDDEEVFLNDTWMLYFHDPNDPDWTHPSYVNVGTIGSVQEFWHHHKCYKPQVQKGMFFLMREGIFPAWDDPANIHGGCMSIKVLKDDMPAFWEELCIKLLGEDLLVDEKKECWNNVNGISTSPKKHFCIIKIWLRGNDLVAAENFNIAGSYYGDILYKSNLDNISNDVNKA